MEKANIFPLVSKKNKVIFLQDGCKEAILVQVHKGKNQLRFESCGFSYRVSLGGKNLFDVDGTNGCPTCGGTLIRGYGKRNLSMKKVLETSKKINLPYKGIKEAVDRVAPILGLLAEGYYILADWEMDPFQSGKHFWDDADVESAFVPYVHVFYEKCRGYRWGNTFGPSQLIPTQSPNMCNQDRVKYYMDRLDEGDSFPRAIGCHIGGGNVLLLDGHHKAAAQAIKGQPVKCMVILPVKQFDGSPITELENKPFLYKPQPGIKKDGVLLDKAGNQVGFHKGFFEMYSISHGDEWKDGEIPASDENWEWGKLPSELSSDSEWNRLCKERKSDIKKKEVQQEEKNHHLYHTPFADISKLLND